jgi:hypothetical protein
VIIATHIPTLVLAYKVRNEVGILGPSNGFRDADSKHCPCFVNNRRLRRSNIEPPLAIHWRTELKTEISAEGQARCIQGEARSMQIANRMALGWSGSCPSFKGVSAYPLHWRIGMFGDVLVADPFIRSNAVKSEFEKLVTRITC